MASAIADPVNDAAMAVKSVPSRPGSRWGRIGTACLALLTLAGLIALALPLLSDDALDRRGAYIDLTIATLTVPCYAGAIALVRRHLSARVWLLAAALGYAGMAVAFLDIVHEAITATGLYGLIGMQHPSGFVNPNVTHTLLLALPLIGLGLWVLHPRGRSADRLALLTSLMALMLLTGLFHTVTIAWQMDVVRADRLRSGATALTAPDAVGRQAACDALQLRCFELAPGETFAIGHPPTEAMVAAFRAQAPLGHAMPLVLPLRHDEDDRLWPDQILVVVRAAGGDRVALDETVWPVFAAAGTNNFLALAAPAYVLWGYVPPLLLAWHRRRLRRRDGF